MKKNYHLDYFAIALAKSFTNGRTKMSRFAFCVMVFTSIYNMLKSNFWLVIKNNVHLTKWDFRKFSFQWLFHFLKLTQKKVLWMVTIDAAMHKGIHGDWHPVIRMLNRTRLLFLSFFSYLSNQIKVYWMGQQQSKK